jgi:3-methyladenine DNA glycosylase AlkD
MLVVIILTERFAKGDEKEQKKIFSFYLKNFAGVNNWDLVDTSAYKIVGNYLLKNPQKERTLKKYSKSKSLWERRLAIVSTFAFIKNGRFDLTLKIAEMLLSDSHDLTHKAVG